MPSTAMALSTRQRSFSTTSAPRRTFSLPARIPPPGSMRTGSECYSSSIGGAEHIQVLFAHSDSRIVNFTFAASTASKGDSLPWNSATERTIASGPLRIYKTIPHNIAFLQSGSALKPLLSRTQCWNVDGKQIFCIQLRPGNYWRVEIMGQSLELDLKCTEFRDAMAKIVAFEVTACPFIRAVSCAPVTESPEALLPAKVWRRPTLRKAESTDVLNTSTSSGPVSGISEGLRRTRTEPANVADRIKPKLDHPISLRDSPSYDFPRLSTSWKETFPDTFQQRRARWESPGLARRISFADSFVKPLHELKQENARRRCSFSADVLPGRWRREIRVDERSETCEIERQDAAVQTEGDQQPLELTFLGHCGLDELEEQPEECPTPTAPSAPYEISSIAPIPIKPAQLASNNDGFLEYSSSLEYPSSTDSMNYSASLESTQWPDFTPPLSPLFEKREAVSLAPPSPAYPSRQSTRPSTPEDPLAPTHWYTPIQQSPTAPKRRQNSLTGVTLASADLAVAIDVDLAVAIDVEPAQISPVPTLVSSGSESDLEEETHELRTPPRSRPSTSALDYSTSRSQQQQLRRIPSSHMLAKTANIAAATANFVVLKPSAFLVALMFSIAARVAARAVTGAAYSLAERGELGRSGWELWDDYDEYGLVPPARSERRRRKSEICERRAWGLEE